MTVFTWITNLHHCLFYTKSIASVCLSLYSKLWKLFLQGEVDFVQIKNNNINKSQSSSVSVTYYLWQKHTHALTRNILYYSHNKSYLLELKKCSLKEDNGWYQLLFTTSLGKGKYKKTLLSIHLCFINFSNININFDTSLKHI